MTMSEPAANEDRVIAAAACDQIARVPMEGEMTFYSADSYRIKVEPGAKRRGLRDGTPGTA